MNLETIGAKDFLRNELDKIQKKNPSYSMRSFSSKLGISSGGLAHIFSGRKKLSIERAYEFAERLKLNEEKKEYFLLLVEFERAKNLERKAETLEKIQEFNKINNQLPSFDLEVDKFKLISDWYAFPVLECVSEYGSNFNVLELAKEFAISTNQVQITLDRLERLGLIKKENGKKENGKKENGKKENGKKENGAWIRTEKRVMVESGEANAPLRSYYKQLSEKSLESIDNQSPQEKVIAAETFCFDPENLEAVKKLTDKYLDDLLELSSKSDNSKTYQAFVNIFNLSQKHTGESNV